MNLLPQVPRFNSNPPSERYNSFSNVNCKYWNYDKSNEFSRLSNSSCQLSNSNKYETIRNSRYYEGDLMNIVIEPNKLNELGKIFTASTKFNSMRLLNSTQNDVRINTNPLRKRKYDGSGNELNSKQLNQDEINNKYNEIGGKESHERSKDPQNIDKNADVIDDDLADYFIGAGGVCTKSLGKPVCMESCVPMKLSEEDIRMEPEGLSGQYCVFDYRHKNVDVEKLAIVDPNFNAKSVEEYHSIPIQSNLLQSCSETPNKVTCGVDSIVSVDSSADISPVSVTPTGVTKLDEGMQKVDNKAWNLIPIDCPRRTRVTCADVNLKNCNVRDPRLSHLRS